jgi:hypothetical protein
MGFASFDEIISEMTTGGKQWRQDFMKTYTGGTVVAGRWYDLTSFTGFPANYIHGNLVSNFDFLGGTAQWTFSSGFIWTSATHLMTKSNTAAIETLSQEVDIVAGVVYEVIWTVGSYAGSGNISLSLGGGTAVTRAANGAPHTDTVTAGGSNNTLLISCASTITAVTIDLVHVRPVGSLRSDFVPYNDTIARNAAGKDMDVPMGGVVTPDTKHLLNMGVWTNVANGAPSVLMLCDFIGCYPKIATNTTNTTILGPQNVIANGTFTGGTTSWTVNSGWAYGTNNVAKNGAGTGTLAQTTTYVPESTRHYIVRYTISNYTVTGTLQVGYAGGVAPVRTITGNGTYIDVILATSTSTAFTITPSDALRCTIDDVVCGLGMPRYSDGKGVRAFYVINATNGANAQNFVMNYADTDGNGLQQLGAVVSNTASAIVGHISHSGVAAGNFGPFLPLAPGDLGIVDVQNAAFSAASASAGFVDLVLVKPLAAIPITAAFYASERDFLNQLPALPELKAGNCLGFIIFAGAVIPNPTMYQGYLTAAWS